MKKKFDGFTLVEVIVVITLIVILGTLGFTSYTRNISNARDSQRKGDLAQVKSAMQLYKQQKGIFPTPGGNFELSLGSYGVVAYQGKLDQNVSLSTLDELPNDPELKIPYIYSVTKNKKEMQIVGTLENGYSPKAIILGNYKTVSINRLPTIVVATNSNIDVESEKTKFIFNEVSHNLPYGLDGIKVPTSNGTNFETLLIDAKKRKFWQNSSFRSCDEIKKAGKSIGNGEYQILDGNGVLSNISCSSM